MANYPAAFSTYRDTNAERISGWTDRFLIALASGPRQLLVDLGCGVGRFARPLAQYFDCVLGIDHDTRMLDIARSQPANNLYYVRASACRTPVSSARADCVLASMLLEHVQDRVRLFAEFQRLLAANGTLLLRTVLPEDLTQTTWYRYSPPALMIEAARVPTLETLTSLAGSAGLRIVLVESVREHVSQNGLAPPLSVRLRAGAYEALSRLDAAEIQQAADKAARDEAYGTVHEVLASSLIRLRHD